MTSDQFWKIVDKYGWSLETDNEGQVVIYTGLKWNETDELVSLSEGEQE